MVSASRNTIYRILTSGLDEARISSFRTRISHELDVLGVRGLTHRSIFPLTSSLQLKAHIEVSEGMIAIRKELHLGNEGMAVMKKELHRLQLQIRAAEPLGIGSSRNSTPLSILSSPPSDARCTTSSQTAFETPPSSPEENPNASFLSEDDKSPWQESPQPPTPDPPRPTTLSSDPPQIRQPADRDENPSRGLPKKWPPDTLQRRNPDSLTTSTIPTCTSQPTPPLQGNRTASHDPTHMDYDTSHLHPRPPPPHHGYQLETGFYNPSGDLTYPAQVTPRPYSTPGPQFLGSVRQVMTGGYVGTMNVGDDNPVHHHYAPGENRCPNVHLPTADFLSYSKTRR